MSAKQICHQRPPWWAGHPERSERARSEATSKNPARGGRKATERSDRDLKARGVGYADPQTVSDKRSEELTGCVPPLLMPFYEMAQMRGAYSDEGLDVSHFV